MYNIFYAGLPDFRSLTITNSKFYIFFNIISYNKKNACKKMVCIIIVIYISFYSNNYFDLVFRGI